jgi:hypothetical protein
MRKLILFLLVAAASLHAQLPNCSYGVMSPQGSALDCNATNYNSGPLVMT